MVSLGQNNITMKKRTFLKTSSVLITGSLLSPMISCTRENIGTNWAGNYAYSAKRLLQPTSVEQVQELVKEHEKLRVLGTRHSFNSIADSTENLISLQQLKQMELNAEAGTVTVGAGVRYGELCKYLDSNGYALHNLASLPHISVAGACATATHGSGDQNGNLATPVSALEIVKADGEVVQLSREKDGEKFLGAVVGLGSLGVVTKVTLDVLPTYTMRQYVYEHLPLEQLKEHFDDIESSGYSVSLFTDWQNQNINQIWIKSKVEEGTAIRPAKEMFGAQLATRNMHPIAALSAENCTEQLGVPGPWYERLPHFKMDFTPSSGEELQSEFFVPRTHAVEAISAIFQMSDQITPHLFISEIRTIDADNLWMSTCYQRPSVAIHFTWKPEWPAVRQLLPKIESALEPYGVRPHWGKLFTIAPSRLQSLYTKHQEFQQLIGQYDPEGKFRNAFVEKNIYSS